MPVIANAALERLRKGEPTLGLIVRLMRSGDIAWVAKACDHDFLFIDMQHGGLSRQTTVDICLAAIGAGVAPIVRVSGYNDPDIPRLLDSGAMGIVVPGVNDAREAEEAVRRSKFPPLGRRSVAAGYPQLGYEAFTTDQAMPALNGTTLLAIMIETAAGLDNVEEIAAVDGVDVLHMGPNDLLADLGLAGQFGHPRADEAMERMVRACKANGRFAGMGGDKDPRRQAFFIESGCQFITTHSDLGYMSAAAHERARFLRHGR